jgi:hypothetical protein
LGFVGRRNGNGGLAGLHCVANTGDQFNVGNQGRLLLLPLPPFQFFSKFDDWCKAVDPLPPPPPLVQEGPGQGHPPSLRQEYHILIKFEDPYKGGYPLPPPLP